MAERTEDQRIDDPRTAEDHALAALAWSSGRRSSWNHLAPDEAATAQMDAARTVAHVAMSAALREATEPVDSIPTYCGRVIVTREWQGSVESTRLCERQTGDCPWQRVDPRMQHGPTCAASADPEEDGDG